MTHVSPPIAPQPDDGAIIRVEFMSAEGDGLCSAVAHVGDRLLDVAQAAGQPLEGTCEGQMACSTCHVLVDPDDFALLSPASADEEDLLDLAPGATRTSRLACQIRLTARINPLRVRIPSGRR